MAVAILDEPRILTAPKFTPVVLPARPLIFATYLAPNVRPVYEFITAVVREQLERPTQLVVGHSFDELRNGQVDFAFLGGLPYVRLADAFPPPIVLLAAPILMGDRYQDQPRYYSDVIVRADSPLTCFDQLHGKSWAYNEPESHSGYLVTLFRLLQLGLRPDFFARSVMTGFHQESIRAVAQGEIDASAIDSQVLAVELHNHPHLISALRIIDTFGPSPIQPLVASSRVPATLQAEVTQIVTSLSGEYAARELSKGLVKRFVPIDDEHYDEIRIQLDAVQSHDLHF